MAVAVPDKGLNLADLVDRFGPMPAERIRTRCTCTPLNGTTC